jgi:hypothetical protein
MGHVAAILALGAVKFGGLGCVTSDVTKIQPSRFWAIRTRRCACRVNLTRPPAEGLFGLLAVTVTTSGAGEAVGTPVDWPLLEVTVIVKPLDSKAPLAVRPVSAVVLFREEPEKKVSGTQSTQCQTP